MDSKKEYRTLPMTELRAEEADGKKVICGHAAVFDSWSETLGGFFPFKEKVRAGAFQSSIEKDDIRALFNHDANRIFGVKYDRAQLKAIRAIKGPALIVASHHGPLDFAFLTYAMYPKRLSIVTAANIYYKKGVQRLLKTIKSAIPKKQFTTDYSSVKSIRKMLDAGVSVVVYPEARYSLDGRQGRVSDSIYKLTKWLKVPVVTLKCNMPTKFVRGM